MTLLEETGPKALSAGQMTARLPHDPRIRLTMLFDAGTMETKDMCLGDPALPSSGVLAASGMINGVAVIGFASDPRVQGGAMGAETCAVIVQAYKVAVARKIPVIGLWQSG